MGSNEVEEDLQKRVGWKFNKSSTHASAGVAACVLACLLGGWASGRRPRCISFHATTTFARNERSIGRRPSPLKAGRRLVRPK